MRARYLLPLVAMSLAQGACDKIDYGATQMVLASNVKNTEFAVREQQVDAGPNENWSIVGRGAAVSVEMQYGHRYELRAAPDGYHKKTVKITEPIKRYDFVFMDTDKWGGGGDGELRKRLVSCDVRIIAVGDGAAMASASGQAEVTRLEGLAKGLAVKLREEMLIKGESVAVVSLRNRNGTDRDRAIADELADKIQGSLIETGWFEVKERIDLRSVLNENDLDMSGIVKNENVRGKLASVKYVVIGGVTVNDKD